MKEKRMVRINLSRFGRKRFDKKGQEVLGMGFGMIFSIMLIVFFVLIAFIVIKEFLGARDCASVGIFVDKFKTDVKKTWNSQIDSHVFPGVLPSGIDYVCFGDVSLPFKGDYLGFGDELGLYEGKEANMFFYPTGKSCQLPFHNVPQIDIERIIRNQNPYCIEVDNGIVKIQIEKDLNDMFVNVRRV
jgi:hypothetical protein|tara:strand:- start:176 stop:736 length:561 start_codon:yes stop_codon:yes gene_type:complete